MRALVLRGEDPGRWCAAVGPAIGPCCYEVSSELAQDFARTFASMGDGVAVPRDRHLDLPAIVARRLRDAGVGEVELVRARSTPTGRRATPAIAAKDAACSRGR